jgi:quercetin dioxygenase-like cupin family protein
MDSKSHVKSRTVYVDRVDPGGMVTTSWGEQSRKRVTSADTLGNLSILDYRAPTGFSPPRHLHRLDDEIFLVMQGQVVIWTPEKCNTANPGDLVLLPKGVAHTWRVYGPDPLHMQIIASAGQFETFFEDIVLQDLRAGDVEALTKVASDAGMDIVGPPLREEDVANILAGRPVS